MAQSQIKAAGESDVTPAGAKSPDFDHDTLKGKEKKVLFSFFIKVQCKINVNKTSFIHILLLCNLLYSPRASAAILDHLKGGGWCDFLKGINKGPRGVEVTHPSPLGI